MNFKKKLIAISALLSAASAFALGPGEAAPDVAAKNQDGKLVRVSDFKGQLVVIYFYPKDDTPGCTTESCNLRDRYTEIRKMNAVVLGVSRQDAESKKKFIAKYKLPFDLLADENGEFAKAFGVGSIFGLGFTKRQSFLIGKDGKIIKFYEKVDPDTHAKEIVEDLKKAL
jgi:peroxiredoxin Q/BCP